MDRFLARHSVATVTPDLASIQYSHWYNTYPTNLKSGAMGSVSRFRIICWQYLCWRQKFVLLLIDKIGREFLEHWLDEKPSKVLSYLTLVPCIILTDFPSFVPYYYSYITVNILMEKPTTLTLFHIHTFTLIVIHSRNLSCIFFFLAW